MFNEDNICIQLTLGLHGGATATKQWSNVSTFQWLDKRGLADTAVTEHQHSNAWESLARRAQLTPVHFTAITNDWLRHTRSHIQARIQITAAGVKVKVKVNVDLYSALSWSHLKDAQVWRAFSRDLTVVTLHCTPRVGRVHPLTEWTIPALMILSSRSCNGCNGRGGKAAGSPPAGTRLPMGPEAVGIIYINLIHQNSSSEDKKTYIHIHTVKNNNKTTSKCTWCYCVVTCDNTIVNQSINQCAVPELWRRRQSRLPSRVFLSSS